MALILYEVTYPFSIIEGEEHRDWLYPSIQAASDAALLEYNRRAQKEGVGDFVKRNSKLSNKPAKLSRVHTLPLDKNTICGIINHEGGRWCREEHEIGRIWYRKLRIEVEIFQHEEGAGAGSGGLQSLTVVAP